MAAVRRQGKQISVEQLGAAPTGPRVLVRATLLQCASSDMRHQNARVYHFVNGIVVDHAGSEHAKQLCDILANSSSSARFTEPSSSTKAMIRRQPDHLTLVQLFAFFVVLIPHITGSIVCISDYYGSPNEDDCDELLDNIADYNDNHPRLFDEEQLRTPGGLSFPGVKNVYPTSVVQVPGFWSLSE